jgi:hypothetical protein
MGLGSAAGFYVMHRDQAKVVRPGATAGLLLLLVIALTPIRACGDLASGWTNVSIR